MTKTWFITGAARGIGFEIASAALAVGDRVVAAVRNPEPTREAFAGAGDRLHVVALDVTNATQIEMAIASALTTFETIDVLVNNAGYGQLGLFEETTAAEVEAQFATNVFGAFAVTRAVLPAMRWQKGGRIFNISSIAGMRGNVGASLYVASKFALEGFSESLALEVARFGIRVTIVEPGYFRTDFLDPSSIRISGAGLADYAEVSEAMRAGFSGRNHQQAGDPKKLATAILQLAGEAEPPMRFAAGSDAYEVVVTKAASLAREVEAWRALSVSTDGTF